MKASSESGECASLISTGDFSVFEAVCLAAMGWIFLLVSWASFLAGPRTPRRDVQLQGGAAGRQTGKDVRIAGTCAALGRAIFSTQSLAYRRPGDKFRARCVGAK